jgi:hypothetical protein
MFVRGIWKATEPRAENKRGTHHFPHELQESKQCGTYRLRFLNDTLTAPNTHSPSASHVSLWGTKDHVFDEIQQRQALFQPSLSLGNGHTIFPLVAGCSSQHMQFTTTGNVTYLYPFSLTLYICRIDEDSRDSSVGLVTDWTSRVRFPAVHSFQTGYGGPLSQHSIQGILGAFFPGVKWQQHEADHSLLCSA